jgi:uncharacterized delta-60 repeat protein
LTTSLILAGCDGGSDATGAGGSGAGTTTTTSAGGGGSGGTTTTSEGGGGSGGTTTTSEGGGGSGGTTTTSEGGGGSGGSDPFVPPVPLAIPLSAAGPDQLQSVTAAADGAFLAAGFAAEVVGGPRKVVVLKLSATGLDTTFGQQGVVTTPLTFAGGSSEIDIATQSDGKIIVSATVANDANPADRDVAVLRLLASGAVDTTFGTGGVTVLNLNDAHDNGMMLVGLDAARALTVDGGDNIFLQAVSRGLGNAIGGGPRTDTDYTVVKLTPAGAVDTTFGEGGQLRLDIAEKNATAHAITALPDGSLLAAGYANTPDVGDTTQVVVYKLTAAGKLDASFATGGLYHQPILNLQTEIYGFAIHGGHMVTAGYGRDAGDKNDYVSLRFDIATGARDTAWGGAPKGAVLVDPSGAMLGSNARGAVGLPGGKTLLHGSTGPGNVPEQDAVFVVLDADGKLDAAYGTGIHVLKLGSDGNDQLWGGALSGDHVALVGYKGGGATQTEATNDDAYAIVFKVQ